MLPHEIEPFRSAHVESIEDKIAALKFALDTQSSETILIDRGLLANWIKELEGHRFAINRFAACFTDEQRTKNRYEATRRAERFAKMKQQ